MELDIGKIAEALLKRIEDEKKAADSIALGVKLLYAEIEKEVRKAADGKQHTKPSGQEEDSSPAEKEHISI